ncbi:MAG: hypothetical protein ABEH64_13505, partial [Salinirussus sp.]
MAGSVGRVDRGTGVGFAKFDPNFAAAVRSPFNCESQVRSVNINRVDGSEIDRLSAAFHES